MAATSIFDEVWSELEQEHGKDAMALPKEIMWLGGAPGAGKGTNTAFIMTERGLTAPPIVISDLLKTPEMEAIKAEGGLVGDLEVAKLLIGELLKEKYATGVIVDGFPRTPVQADLTRKLYGRMMSNYNRYKSLPLASKFQRPIFRICVLYVDQTESVRRQLARGAHAKLHNARVRDTGEGELLPERATDSDPALAKKRYVTFRDSTFRALEQLGKHFIYNVVQAMGTFQQVEKNIKREMDYQSCLELNPDTHSKIHDLPRASEVITHARQELVSRLDSFSEHNPEEFQRVIAELENVVYPVIVRHSLSGKCHIPVVGTLFEHSQLATDMAISILSDRGFRVQVITETAALDSRGIKFIIKWTVPQLRSK